MLLDNNGDAVFIYTPPSLHSRGTSKARDPRHAAKLFQRAQADTTGRWEVFHFTSHDNPHISDISLAEVAADMTHLAYRQEILAEDVEEAPGALWTRATLVPQGFFCTAPRPSWVFGSIACSASGRLAAGPIGVRFPCGRGVVDLRWRS
jgi:hypothetical protein